jgi:hypothetical protein
MPGPYFAVFTTVGLQRLAEAQASGIPLVFTDLAVGDGDGAEITPSAGMTALVNETARVSINNVDITPGAPDTVRVEGLIPAATGSFTIREAGLFNGDGELLVIASYPPIYKPVPADGVSVEEYIRILLVYSGTEAVSLTIDTSVVVATRLYVDEADDALDERITALESVHSGAFGDGSDGDILLDGFPIPPGYASLAGSTYTLTRDVFAENLTINNGMELATAGFRVYCKGTLTTIGTGKITANGSAGSGINGGAGGVAGAVLGGGAGATGVSSGAGAAASNLTSALGGAGGAGGTGAGGAGGAGGTATAPTAATGNARLYTPATLGHIIGGGSIAGIRGGAGGGAGGGDGGSGQGWGGGGGGGVLCVAARILALASASALEAKGGAGVFAGLGAGGGGGGGGGALIVVYQEKQNGTTFSAATNCPAGAGGAGAGALAGANGSNGNVIELALADEAVGIGHLERGFITVGSVGLGTSYAVSFDEPFASAVGAAGYQIDVEISYTTPAYDPVSWWITEKDVNGFTLNLTDDVFTGEIRWSARR